MREHRTLVFVTDDESSWGFWCADCPESKVGFKSDIRPRRLAARHELDTRPVLQEAS